MMEEKVPPLSPQEKGFLVCAEEFEIVCPKCKKHRAPLKNWMFIPAYREKMDSRGKVTKVKCELSTCHLSCDFCEDTFLITDLEKAAYVLRFLSEVLRAGSKLDLVFDTIAT